MFKRRPIYIILLIIFTLLLCADIAGYSLAVNTTSNMSGMPSGFPSDGTQMHGNFNGGMTGTYGSSGTSSSAMPETSSGSSDNTTAAGNGAGKQSTESAMPETSSGSSDTSAAGNSSGQTNGNFDPSKMQDGSGMPTMMGGQGQANSTSGLASFIISWWIPIGILCILVDVFCIFMLIRISRRKSSEDIIAEDEASKEKSDIAIIKKPEISSYEQRRRKKRRTLLITIIILGILIMMIVGYVVVRSIYTAQLAEEETVPVVSAEAASADIDTSISGTGTLTDADAEEITVPDEVKIKTYNVENGDEVKEGDVLATVDHTSVMKAIEDLQDAMDLLDEEINTASSDEIASKIKASVAGRVKMIYAKEGTSVDDTMYNNGALMLISLDGLMAADIETDADISVGDSAVVALADGTTETGRVVKFTQGVATITVSDDNAAYGEEVTITDKSGNALGKSTLYIHSELKVTGFSGSVSDIKCAVDDEVSSGETLITLTDTEYTAEYKLLLEKRNDYVDEMDKLMKLSKDSNVYAEYAGTVLGIDEDDATTTTSETEDATTSQTGSATSETNNTTASQTGSATAQTDAVISGTGNVSVSQLSYTLPAQSVLASKLVYEPSSSENSASGVMLLSNNSKGADDATVTGYSNYAAIVSSVTYNSIDLLAYSKSISISDYSSFDSLGVTTAMMTTKAQISPSSSTPVYMYKNGVWTSCPISEITAGDVIILTYGTSSSSDSGTSDDSGSSNGSGGSSGGASTSPSTTSSPSSTSTSGSDSSGSSDSTSGSGDTTSSSDTNDSSTQLLWIVIAKQAANTNASGKTGGGNGSASAGTGSTETEEPEEPEDIYSLSEPTIMSVTPDAKMSVTITVDELDILSIEKGQEATITLDALSDQTFTGAVTDIDMTGANSGGSTKFTAVVTLDKTDQMLAGMNASVSITLASNNCDVTIPVAAINESDSGIIVYTSYDEDSNELGGPVNVTTGISDGTNVEILSGLSSGDKVWYEYEDTVNISSSLVSSSNGGGFNLMDIFGGNRRRP